MTSSRPLKVQVDGWESAHSWDQVEELAPTLAPSRAPVSSAMPGSLGFAMQRALPRSGRERELQQTQALVSQRAAELTLDKRLTLGLSVDAIEEYIAALPADVVEQCNENRPINGVRVPANAHSTATSTSGKSRGGASRTEARRTARRCTSAATLAWASPPSL